MGRHRSLKQRAAAGFTLIELLVVVMIIGILAAMAIPQYFKVVEKSRTAEARSFVSSLRSSEEAYLARSGNYTSNIGSLDISFSNCNTSGGTQACGMKDYMFQNIAVAACSGTQAPGYTITVTRSGSVAAKYGPYNIIYDRCADQFSAPPDTVNSDLMQ